MIDLEMKLNEIEIYCNRTKARQTFSNR